MHKITLVVPVGYSDEKSEEIKENMLQCVGKKAVQLISKISENPVGSLILKCIVDFAVEKKDEIEVKHCNSGVKIIWLKLNQSFHIRLIPKKRKDNMKLQVEIEEINISEFINQMFDIQKNKKIEKERLKLQKALDENKKKNEEELRKKEKKKEINVNALFAMLEAVNKSVDDQEIIKLCKILIDWINENKIVNTVLQEYLEAYTNPEGKKDKKIEVLEMLKLQIGDISLEVD